LMPAIEQFKALLEEALNEAMIEHAGIECYATPRRLVAFSQAMSPVQPEREVKVRGPSAGVAFDESGKPTKAAIGFARSQGVSVDELIIEETERGKFVFAVKRVGGRRTLDVLSEVFARCDFTALIPEDDALGKRWLPLRQTDTMAPRLVWR